ncbi:hypothetical protein [Methylomonas methanica]|uniref:Phage coat protein n=1 Tax=Methylomonas methanica (strain DSM 25384 / MC09) TaxID=857087 RepID=F9ZV51_METMM|nr:hypothetical protein [Methylomonas methanica]AEF99484.1 hypothetical protein Metme_1048 [Methylomonas methanica MC09]
MKYRNIAKKYGAVIGAVSALALATFGSAHADPIAMDFSGLTGAVDTTTITAAITAFAAVKIAPGMLKWGFNKVIGWFR